MGFGLETAAGVLELTASAPGVDGPGFEALCAAVALPGACDQDGTIPYDHGVRLAALLGRRPPPDAAPPCGNPLRGQRAGRWSARGIGAEGTYPSTPAPTKRVAASQ